MSKPDAVPLAANQSLIAVDDALQTFERVDPRKAKSVELEFNAQNPVFELFRDGVSVMPKYRKPFDRIFERALLEEWSGREDSNLRPPGPEPGALPDCATPRTMD
jgi:hypothetical protein